MSKSTADTALMNVEYRRMSDIEPVPVKWLWPGRFARGKFSIIAGNPGVGKSQIISSMAAIVTVGGLWPDGKRCEPGNVIILSAEDDPADTIRPRLDAVGADVRRVFTLDAVIGDTGRRAFNLTDDLSRLAQMIKEIGGAALIAIDPLTAYLGRSESYRTADIRALLSPVGDLAAKHDASIIGVSHLTKGGGDVLTCITGSFAFVAAPRAVYLVVNKADDQKCRLFLPLKCNIGSDTTGLAFTVEPQNLPGGIETSSVIWQANPVTVTVEEAMLPQGNPEKRSALGDAKQFLVNLLADGLVLTVKIQEEAKAANIAWRTIQRAQKSLNIKPCKVGMDEGWSWQLPPKATKNHEQCQ